MCLSSPTAQAQEADDRDYVDVALTLAVPDDERATTQHKIHVIVVNNGTRPAYDVEVVVDVVSPDESHMEIEGRTDVQAPVGQIALDGTALRWTIPELGPLQREVLIPLVEHEGSGGATYDNSLNPHEIFGTVTTASFENDRHKGNNTDRVWSYDYFPRNVDWIQAAVDYIVDVSVDNSQPAPGNTVNFTITAVRDSIQSGARAAPPIDLKVEIELTGGLAHTGTPSYFSTNTSQARLSPLASAIFQNDVFTIGTGIATDESFSDSVTLPVAVASDAVVNEQCLTATLTGNPPPGNGPLDDAIANNVAKLCLGVPNEKVIFRDGTTDLVTLFPCVGETAVPCNTAETVELAVTVGTAAKEVDPDTVFQPDNVVVQIEDPAGRAVSDAGLLWRTGNAVDHTTAGGLGILPGVAAKLVVPIGTDGYRQHTFAIADATPGSASNPGSVKWRLASSDFTVLDTNSKVSLGPIDMQVAEYDTVFIFSALGTYHIDMTLGAEHTVSGDDDTDTETYTFHIGPIADLGVSDGGASPHVAADRNALTIVAVNNGPEQSPRAQVTGLPTGAEVIHVSRGTYNSASGEWDIGELWPRGYYSSRGEPEPTLVLSAPAGDTASVSIAAESYKVCIGSDASTLTHTTQSTCVADTTSGGSWHTGPVYDHSAANNTATITARAGTAGEPHPDASKNLSVVGGPIANILFWEPVTEVNGIPVTHYEIEYAGGGWETLKRDVEGRFYVDMTDSLSNRANRAYRVRAVNGSGYPGPWTVSSASGGGRAVPPNAPRNFKAALVTDTDVELTWAAAEHGEALALYMIQASDHAGGPWTTVAPLPGDATRWIHPNLPKSGATKYYRIRAHNRSSHSAWVEASVGLTTPPEGATPSSLRAQRYTTRLGNHGIQVWFTPSYTCDLDATDCFTVIEYREAGNSAWWYGSQNYGDYGVVPWDPDAQYFTEGSGRESAVRLDAAYDIRVCKLTEAQLEAKHAEGKPEGSWCVGHRTGQVRVPAGE